MTIWASPNYHTPEEIDAMIPDEIKARIREQAFRNARNQIIEEYSNRGCTQWKRFLVEHGFSEDLVIDVDYSEERKTVSEALNHLNRTHIGSSAEYRKKEADIWQAALGNDAQVVQDLRAAVRMAEAERSAIRRVQDRVDRLSMLTNHPNPVMRGLASSMFYLYAALWRGKAVRYIGKGREFLFGRARRPATTWSVVDTWER